MDQERTEQQPSPASEEERRARWLAHRKTLITGTDVAAVLGLSKFRSPIDVWLDKRGLSGAFPDTDQLEFGRRFQRPILDLYAERLGQPLEHTDPYAVTVVDDFPLLGASLDARWTTGDRRPVDAKNVFMRSEEWGESGTDAFPLYYQLQLAVQMMATKTDDADLAVCFGGCAFAAYTIHRDPEVDALIRERVTDWWHKHVVADVPPEPDASESYSRYLAQRFAKHTEQVVEADALSKEWAARLAHARDVLAQADAQRAEAENFLKAFMGERSAIRGLCTWRTNKDSQTTDWKAVAEGLRTRDTESAERFAALLKSHTTTKPGARVFRFSPKGELTDGK